MSKLCDKRRVTISKFSNRPPFDRKKPRDREDVAEKIRCYPEDNCRNCCKNRAESPVNERKLMRKSLKFDASTGEPAERPRSGGTSVAFKVLEQFRNIHIGDSTEIQQVPIQTLYHKTKACKLGKNIHKHGLMKRLLANWHSDGPREGSPQERKSKYKKSKWVCDGGEVMNCDVMKRTGTYHTSDKKTSTTGLLWPPRIRDVLHRPSGDWAYDKSTPPCNCKVGLNATKEGLENGKFTSESFSEKVSTTGAWPKSRGSPRKSAADIRTRRIREKTFVQSQVKKLNKTRQSPVTDQNTNKESKHAATNGYIGMMNNIRHNCPQFRSSSTNLQPGFESAHSWSDPSETSLILPEIKFPRETKTAVDQRLTEQKKSKIFWFNVTGHDARRPHLAGNNPEIGKGGNNDGEVHKNFQLQCITGKNGAAEIQRNNKFNVPCKKNMLCDKGEQHAGSCGVHSYSKVVYSAVK